MENGKVNHFKFKRIRKFTADEILEIAQKAGALHEELEEENEKFAEIKAEHNTVARDLQSQLDYQHERLYAGGEEEEVQVWRKINKVSKKVWIYLVDEEGKETDDRVGEMTLKEFEQLQLGEEIE